MDPKTKIEKYKEMIKLVESFTANGGDKGSVMTNVTAVMKVTFPQTSFWEGF